MNKKMYMRRILIAFFCVSTIVFSSSPALAVEIHTAEEMYFPPQTGVILSILPYILIALAAVVLIIIFIAAGHRKNRGGRGAHAARQGGRRDNNNYRGL